MYLVCFYLTLTSIFLQILIFFFKLVEGQLFVFYLCDAAI